MSRIDKIAKAFEPAKAESEIYTCWLEKGYFTPAVRSDREAYTIVMPPPNITGQLHMGHALTTPARHSNPLQTYAGLQCVVASGNRPCLDRYRGAYCGRDEIRRLKQRECRAGSLFGTGLGMEKTVWQSHHRAAQTAGIIL